MLKVRHASDRGRAEFGWLDSRHTFSFGDYYDPRHMGFGPLRVINEDRVQPGKGFGTHSHRDMEIVSYVLEGALEHKDSLGTGSVIRSGDVQRMSAGTGVQHSEFNHSRSELVHFLQIWIIPDQQGLQPGYAEKAFPESEKRGQLRLVISGDGRDGSIPIHQDADLYSTVLKDGESTGSRRTAMAGYRWRAAASPPTPPRYLQATAQPSSTKSGSRSAAPRTQKYCCSTWRKPRHSAVLIASHTP